MEILKKRKTAAAVLAVAVIIALVLSAAVDCAQVRKLFYDGVEYDGYLHSSVADNLSARAAAANGLVSIAAGYDELAEQAEGLRTARRTLVDAQSIPEMYSADSALQQAYEALAAAMESTPLGEDERADAAYYMQNMNGARLAIAESGYNERVDKLDGGLLKLLGGLGLVDIPERFG